MSTHPYAPHRLHPSVPGHWVTELVVLQTLNTKSRAQHRSQIFLSRLDGVIRIAKLIASSFEPEASPTLWTGQGQRLLPRMQRALITAATISTQMIHLRHFLPLQTCLVAAYSRMYGLTLAMLGVSAAITPSHIPVQFPLESLPDYDVGEILHRSSEVVPSDKRVPESQNQTVKSTPDVDFDDPAAAKTVVKLAKKKKRKHDVMDDIFGF